jgi:hypothetical protein
MAAFFVNDKGEKIDRTRCQIYTRVMGYCRPVNNFNTWKKSEFYSRNYFKEDNCSCNVSFMEQFA